MRELFVAISIFFVYMPKIIFYAWAARQFWKRWKTLPPADATPEQLAASTLARQYSLSHALLKAFVALEALSWFSILFIFPRIFVETPFVLSYGLWIVVNIGQVAALFFTLRVLGIVKWK